MKKEQDICVLLRKITRASDEQALSKILFSLKPQNIDKPVRIAFVNAHALNLCCNDAGFLRHLLSSDYVFRDGSGMKILYKMLGCDPGLNLNGTDLIPRIVTLYVGCDTALLGTKNPYLERAAEAVKEKGVTPVLMMDGFQEDNAYLDAARNRPAPLIILAMGMPKQERVAELLAANLDYPCVIVCGGAILDFIGGKVTRAPLLFRRLGIEWLYRLGQEPRRLFRRYVIGNIAFLLRSFRLVVTSNRMHLKSFD
ncbi:MAG: WecB/TagA/CpsF family glycosyltransferase [Micavibrio sp.]